MTLNWEDGMSVGVESIDVGHRQVWRRIRHLARAVSDGETGEVRAALRFLESYLAEHNAEEERWMEATGYPGAREHTRAHDEILARVAIAGHAGQGDAVGPLLEAADRVARTLEAHMRLDDLKLGRFWTARENLRRLAEAAGGARMALTPLPGALAPVRPPAGERPKLAAAGGEAARRR